MAVAEKPGDRGQGQPAELTTSERDELHRLRQEADELRSEVEIQREILRKTAAWFAEIEEDQGEVGRDERGMNAR